MSGDGVGGLARLSIMSDNKVSGYCRYNGGSRSSINVARTRDRILADNTIGVCEARTGIVGADDLCESLQVVEDCYQHKTICKWTSAKSIVHGNGSGDTKLKACV